MVKPEQQIMKNDYKFRKEFSVHHISMVAQIKVEV